MCGIAGVLQLSPGARPTVSTDAQAAVARMVERLQHRGPDGCGLGLVATPESDTRGAAPAAVFGHTRLAIIDLSEAGRQPMRSVDGALDITFNGEIYNFRQLRDELGPDGWASSSDTEVILRAYARWGRDCVRHLRGMFALAIWDGRRRELFLARDRLGIKPLYYSATPTGFVFASEVRALLASGYVPRALDPTGLAQYLTYQSVPAPRTLISAVRALEPGHWMVVDERGSRRSERYWDMLDDARASALHVDGRASRRAVAALLRESVALHQVSDVPVGAFLSGGIDSSVVVGLMREAGHVPRTFSIGFAEQAFDETQHARTVASHFGTDHTEIRLKQADLIEQLPDALARLDQPTGDGINTYVVSGAVRATGIKVALSGLGGDELFAGYPTFARLQRAAPIFAAWGCAPPPLRRAVAHGVRMAGASSIAATKVAALLASDGHLANLYPTLRQVFTPAQVSGLLSQAWLSRLDDATDPYQPLLRAAFAGAGGQRLISCISYAEARTYMHDVLLHDTDQMSMAHGLEVRVPFLDHVLVEYVLGLADHHKRPNGTPKRLLVESLDGLLPAGIVRRPKQGFALPFAVWMRAELRTYCEQRLAPARLAERGILRPESVQQLWTSFVQGRPGTSWSRLWLLVVLEEWLSRNQVV